MKTKVLVAVLYIKLFRTCDLRISRIMNLPKWKHYMINQKSIKQKSGLLARLLLKHYLRLW